MTEHQVSMTRSVDPQWSEAVDPAAFLRGTVRKTDSPNRHEAGIYPDADAMEMASTPWYHSVIRDVGDYVGRHRLSNSWVLREVPTGLYIAWFKTNLRGNR